MSHKKAIEGVVGGSGSTRRFGLTMLRLALVGILLASGVGTFAAAQEQRSAKIILDIPLGKPVPEDSEEHLTIVVGGMMKSRSGAT